MDRQTGARFEESKGNGSTVSLSLYLIVLAFFILLNAVSQRQEARSQDVLASLSATFSGHPSPIADSLEQAAGGVGVDTHPGFEDSVRELFQSALPVARITLNSALSQLQVMVPADSVFVPGKASFRLGHDGLLDRLGEILARELPGQRFEVEVLIAAPRVPELPGQRALSVDRAGALARALVARGLAPPQVLAGVEEGDAATLRFVFTTRPFGEPEAPRPEG